MKILIIRLFPYEINFNSYNIQEIGLAKALIKKGNQCDIVFYTKGKERKEKIEVIKGKYITIFWMRGINFFKNGLYGKKLINLAENYDIVQSSEYDQIYNLKLNRKLGDKLVIYHGPYYSKFNKGYNFKCKLFDILILLTNNKYKQTQFITKSILAEKFLEKKGYKNVIPIGVGLDIEKIEDTGKKVEKLEWIENLNSKYKYLLYIGKIEKRRNIKFLIDVLKNSIKVDNTIRLILVGNGNQKYIDKILNYAREEKVLPYIIYKKSIKQENIKDLYSKCDFFLLPTSYDIFGMVLLEAMYFGLSVVTTLNGGSSMLIKNYVNGFIEDMNVNNWIKVINTEKVAKIGNNARQIIRDQFTWDVLSEKFINIYKGMF